MKTIKCYQCKNEIINTDKFTTGYGIDKHNHKICFACCVKNDLNGLKNAKIGDRFTFYYDNVNITNWPGTMQIKPYYTKSGKHNFWNCKRLDLWFNVNGNKFWGKQIGHNTQIVHIKRIKNDILN